MGLLGRQKRRRSGDVAVERLGLSPPSPGSSLGEPIQRIAMMATTLAITAALGVCTGCGESLPPTVRVHGKVTWKGEPLSDGKVVFQPEEIAEGLPRRPATGDLGPDGTYELTTFRKGDGAVPGRYAVLVHSYISQPTMSNPSAPYIWRIPDRYGDSKQTELSATVSRDKGDVTLDFEIKE